MHKSIYLQGLMLLPWDLEEPGVPALVRDYRATPVRLVLLLRLVVAEAERKIKPEDMAAVVVAAVEIRAATLEQV
jgi:hypothetical protein